MRSWATAAEPQRSRAADALLSLPSERLIAFARVTLVVFALAAIAADPPADARSITASSILLGAYLAYATVLAVRDVFRKTGELTRLAIHAVDVLAVGILMHLMEGSTGPFFIFFTFVLLAGTLQWNWRGAMGTALVLLTTFFLLGILDGAERLSKEGETSRLIMRGGYLLVASAMFAYVGAYRERSMARLAKLAAWPPEHGGESGFPDLSASLAHAADVLRAERVLAIWEEADEPFVYVSVWSNGRVHSRREPPDTYAVNVAPELSKAVFVTPHSGDRLLAARDDAASSVTRPALDPRLVEAFQIYGAICAPLQASNIEGRLFVFRQRTLSDDTKLLARISATRIAIELEYQRLSQQHQEMAAMRERIRVARDIHDGLLQTLTAAGLQLKRLAHEHPEDSGRLDEIRAMLADQQRELRSLIDVILNSPMGEFDQVSLDEYIRARLKNGARQWELAVKLRVLPRSAIAPRELAREIAQLLSEAASNAARHGQANKISVVVHQAQNAIRLRVRDNGAGANVSGLQENTLPRSISGRVAALGGHLQTRSSPHGFELRIEVPLP
jgi:signal transduction histidine kinase